MSIILLAALLPVIVLLSFIYHQDSMKTEPANELLKAFFYGIGSVFVSMLFSTPLTMIYNPGTDTLWGCVYTSFMQAAVPEELAKLIMLGLFLRKCEAFDEHLDGIVYACCVGMGFAAVENIMYVFDDLSNWTAVAFIRAFLAVPAHFFFAVAMGYYYSLQHWDARRRTDPEASTHVQRYRWLMILVPVFLHGTYDTICMFISVLGSGILFIILLLFCWWMWKESKRRISEHFTIDKVYFDLGQDHETGEQTPEEV